MPECEFVVYIKQELTDPGPSGTYTIETEVTVVWPDGVEETFGHVEGVSMHSGAQMPEDCLRRHGMLRVFAGVADRWSQERAPGAPQRGR